MAFEDVYAEVDSTSYVKGFYDSVNEDYLRPLLALLPPGPIWEYEEGDEMWELVTALSYALTRIEARGKDLFEEVDPRTAFELLSDWERVLGLPGANPSPPTTVAARRLAAHGKLLGFGDPTPAFFEEVAAGTGYTVTVESHPFDVFVAGSVAGLPLYGQEWPFLWTMTSMGGTEDETLKYLVKLAVPSHTLCLFKLAKATWDVRTSQFGGDDIWAVAYQEALWVAIGDTGKISTSTDGATWTARTNDGAFGGIFLALTYLPNLHIIGGTAGELQTSPDGITWTARTSGFGADSIQAFNVGDDDVVVAVGNNGKISTSTDGLTWTARTAAGGYTSIFYDAIYGRSLHVIGGQTGEIQTSPDGATWTARTSNFGTDDVNAFAYGNGTLVAVGDNGKISSSTDGITWTARTSQFGSDNINDVTYGDGLFVAVGNAGKVSTSSDGITWTARTSQFGSSIVYDVVYGDGLFVIGGAGPKVAVSEDGETWVARTYAVDPGPLTLAHGNYLFVAGGASGNLDTTPYGEL